MADEVLGAAIVRVRNGDGVPGREDVCVGFGRRKRGRYQSPEYAALAGGSSPSIERGVDPTLMRVGCEGVRSRWKVDGYSDGIFGGKYQRYCHAISTGVILWYCRASSSGVTGFVVRPLKNSRYCHAILVDVIISDCHAMSDGVTVVTVARCADVVRKGVCVAALITPGKMV